MYKMQRYALPQIVPVVGQRRAARMNNAVQTHYVQLLAQAQVDITTLFTDVLNRGSVWALFDEVGISDGGDDVMLLDGPTLRFMSEMHSPSALDFRRLGTAGVQAATIIRESAKLYFAHPLSANPSETVFRERDKGNQVEVFVNQKAAGATLNGLARGAGVGAVTNVTVDSTQHADRFTPAPPLFIPTVRQMVVPVAAANPALEAIIKVQNPLRAIIVKQETDQGEVGDIITSLRLLSDTRQIIGPNFESWRKLTQEQQYEFGGDVFDDASGYGQNGYLGLNFQTAGRLSNVLDAPREPNLRFEFNSLPSAQTGATNSRIRITLIELERRAGLVAAEVPFAI